MNWFDCCLAWSTKADSNRWPAAYEDAPLNDGGEQSACKPGSRPGREKVLADMCGTTTGSVRTALAICGRRQEPRSPFGMVLSDPDRGWVASSMSITVSSTLLDAINAPHTCPSAPRRQPTGVTCGVPSAPTVAMRASFRPDRMYSSSASVKMLFGIVAAFDEWLWTGICLDVGMLMRPSACADGLVPKPRSLTQIGCRRSSPRCRAVR